MVCVAIKKTLRHCQKCLPFKREHIKFKKFKINVFMLSQFVFDNKY